MKANTVENINRRIVTISASLFISIVLGTGPVLAARYDYWPPQKVPAPEDNQTTVERVNLGKALFFDPRLSGSNWISCGTCHNPALGWSDGLPTAVGVGMKVLKRSTPAILNVAYNKHQFWDGRARTLEHQAVGPILADEEMAQDMPSLIAELMSIKGYKPMFDRAYQGEGITEKTIGKAIAAFERTIVSSYNTPFDRWIKGDESAISEAAKRGFNLFDGKARCNLCHMGHNFQDDGFHNIGLPDNTDDGRYEIKKVKILKGAFKTPTLRNISKTAPYMHNGVYSTLEDVLNHYDKGGANSAHLSPNIKPLSLTAGEKEDLQQFLYTLDEEVKEFAVPVLPN
ncbi:MAG: tryptophan tryptophylquinone biosynthesis enzyme MauG [Gammaproteobacteria bacterium]|nr:tryptophan tryptophylquinone biosynthesis enzyme MauG [Gammaproteobacteria bacterium]